MSASLDLFRTLENGDRGVVATEDVEEGQLLLLLPITCSLYIPTDEELKKSPESFPEAVRFLRANHPGLSPFLATSLALMAEMAAGAASPFAPYLATLPPNCPDCLLHWTDQEKQDLKGSSLEDAGEAAADVYGRHVAPIAAARRDLWPEAGATLDRFLAAAGLVQSRAFHLEAENWVSGVTQVSALEGGTQVYLLPGIDMINHSHNAQRRNARLERVNVTAGGTVVGGSAAAAKDLGLEGGASAAGGEAKAPAYFIMRADKPIPAGTEVLHTYGDLSDSQLLQTYGFLDSEDDFKAGSDQAEAAAAAVAKKRGRMTARQAAAAAAAAAAYRNPHNAALVPYSTVQQVCSGLLASMDQAPSAAALKAKREFLATAGVLQAAAPEATQFVVLASAPLPEELSTTVQVLLMMGEEFKELRKEHLAGRKDKEADKDKAADKEGGGASGSQGPAAAAPDRLALGTTLLAADEDFAEMVCIAMLQVIDACLERYPTSAKEDVRLLREGGCTGRRRLAVRVRLGEKDVLQGAKKAVVELMGQLREMAAAEAEEEAMEEAGSSSEDEDADSEDGSEGDSEEESEEEASPPAKKGKGAGGKAAAKAAPAKKGSGGKAAAKAKAAPAPAKGRGKQQRAGLGAKAEGKGKGKGKGKAKASSDGDDDLLMGSDDSDKVGYGAVDYDDGIGEAHDRGAGHDAPQD